MFTLQHLNSKLTPFSSLAFAGTKWGNLFLAPIPGELNWRHKMWLIKAWRSTALGADSHPLQQPHTWAYIHESSASKALWILYVSVNDLKLVRFHPVPRLNGVPWGPSGWRMRCNELVQNHPVVAHPSLKPVSAEGGSLFCTQGKAIKPSERAPLNTSVTAHFVLTTS